MVLPHARQQPAAWRYLFEKPAGEWFQPGFDDAAWEEGQGGFGTPETPNTQVGTTWKTEEIWLRRDFAVDRLPTGELYALVHHDEDTEIYLNGVLAAEATWYNTDYDLLPVSAAAARALKPGLNTIAVHCRQTYGGQYVDVGLVSIQENRWPREKAWKWYRSQPWPCGFNYVPANAISYTEMWMPYNFDAQRIDRELELAEGIGLNCLRVVLPFVVWEHDPAAFKKRLDTFLGVCERRGIRVMFALFDDCVFGPISDPVYGQQPEVVEGWYANGWTPSPGHTLVRTPAQWPRLQEYVRDVVGSFAEDRRVWVWDLYNEPTNGGLGDVSIPLVENVFAWARDVNPAQPLTVGQWNGNGALNRVIYRNSDLITFHDYGPAENLERHIAELKKHDRPVVNTEWLNRGRGSLIATCLPVFRNENVGCLHWGLVNGKTQTDLNWGHRPGQPHPPVWQHDLFRGDFSPYDEKELALLREAIAADKVGSKRAP
ncbi:MAG: cellulase family glycosylhydrolase [Thermoguttaceae bacterium]